MCALVEGDRRCADVDSTGSYELGDLPEGMLAVEVTCNPVFTGSLYRVLAADSIAARSDDQSRRNWSVSTAGCDQRIVRKVRGRYRGYYSTGFEESSFSPCPADAWFLPSDSLEMYPYDARNAWLTLSDEATWPPIPQPLRPDTILGSVRYYIEVSGTVIGPKPSGHLGVAAFELVADTIHERRRPTGAECR